jgi:outer membrane protein insertion porin family
VRAVTLVVAALLGPTAAAADGLGPPGAVPAERVQPEAGPAGTRDVELQSPEVARALTRERVEISGREQVSSRQIELALRREGIVEGAEILWPEDPRVDRARDRLRATGYFKRVTLGVEPVEGTRDRVVLVVELEERSSVAVEAVYLGSSKMTPFRGGFSVAERNFLGRGVHVGGSLIWGTLPRIDRARRQQAYKVFAEAPRLGRAPLGVLGSAYIISASEPYRVGGAENDPNPDLFRTFDYSRVGGLLGLTFPLTPSLSLGVDYRFERIDALLPRDPAWVQPEGTVVPVRLDVRGGVHRLTAAHFGVVWDGRDEAFLAGRGGRFVLDLQLSSPAIGSQYEYIKLVAGGAYSFRLPWRHWLTPSVSGGQIAGLAPVFEQFYSGDLSDWTPGREQSLRYSTRNPIDVFGMGIDARTFGVIFGRVDLEYVWPLFRRTRTRRVYGGDLFLSTGIFSLAEDRATRQLRRDAGQRVAPLGFNANLGLRLDTALGTFNISVGNILERTPL